MIRISNTLKVLLLEDAIDLAQPERSFADALISRGAITQALLIETVGNFDKPMCPLCMDVDPESLKVPGALFICPACGGVFFGMKLRNRKGMDWWYTWPLCNPEDLKWQGNVATMRGGFNRDSTRGDTSSPRKNGGAADTQR